MRLSRVDRARCRLLLVFLGGLLLALGAAATSSAASRVAPAKPSPHHQWAATVAVAAPSAGDVSYAMVRVRLTGRRRLTLPAGVTRQATVFSSRIAGLAIRARSAQWRALRASSRVYVVVAAVPGASAERDVGLFILRRQGSGGAASGQVTFTVGNARAQLGSFWVHGVNPRGYADVFTGRNILTTALANWSRYVVALRAADAIRAAMHPRILAPPATTTAAAIATAAGAKPPVRVQGPWTGGQHPDARLLTMYGLLIDALHNPLAYGAFKRSPVVPAFIAHELNNPALAARWQGIVANVPVTVPDRYAALAQEEQRFTTVRSPKITRDAVTIGDSNNSSTVTQSGLIDTAQSYLTVEVPEGIAGGTVEVNAPYVGHVWECTLPACNYGFAPRSDGLQEFITLQPFANNGSVFTGWGGCTDSEPESDPPLCDVILKNGGTQEVTAHFAVQTYPLTVTAQGTTAGSGGSVVSNPAGISCGLTCAANFNVNTAVTLTAQPGANSVLAGWTDCPQSSGSMCTVTMNQAQSVTATFAPVPTPPAPPAPPAPPPPPAPVYPLTVTYQPNAFAPSHSGYVMSTPAGIECGAVPQGDTSNCSANFAQGTLVTLTAIVNQGAFELWQGCTTAVPATTCTLTKAAATDDVVAMFG